MAFQIADRVKETTTTTGTGTFNLGGAVSQFQTFVAVLEMVMKLTILLKIRQEQIGKWV